MTETASAIRTVRQGMQEAQATQRISTVVGCNVASSYKTAFERLQLPSIPYHGQSRWQHLRPFYPLNQVNLSRCRELKWIFRSIDLWQRRHFLSKILLHSVASRGRRAFLVCILKKP